MIIGIGTDIVEINRVEKAIKSNHFIAKCFTVGEIEYLRNKKAASYAGIFAAKEAAVKALGTGFSKGIQHVDVEVIHNEDNKPLLVLHNAALAQASLIKASNYHISISHSEAYATAMCVMD